MVQAISKVQWEITNGTIWFVWHIILTWSFRVQLMQSMKLKKLSSNWKMLSVCFVKAPRHRKSCSKFFNLPEHKLIQQVSTRWNSAFYMLERYLEQYKPIRMTLCIQNRNDLVIPAEKNNLIEGILQSCTHFKQWPPNYRRKERFCFQ